MPRQSTAEKPEGVDAWITPAAQARSRRTLAAILDSAIRLTNEKPFDEITVSEICRSAGCSPPTFYQRFRDKEALLHAIHEKYTQDTLDIVHAFLAPSAWDGRPVEWLVRALVGGIFELERGAIGLRITAVRRSHSDERFAERIRLIRRELYRHIGASIAHSESPQPIEDPEHAARFLVRLIQGVAVRHLEGTHLEDEPFDRDELVEDLSRVALAYLGVPPTPAPRPWEVGVDD